MRIGSRVGLPDDTGAVDRATASGRRRAIFAVTRSLAIAAARGSSGTGAGAGAGAGNSSGDSRCHRCCCRCLSHRRPPRLLVTLTLALFRLHVAVTTTDSLCDFVLWPRYRLYPFWCFSLLWNFFKVDPVARPRYRCC